MNISLTKKLQEYVQNKVKSGLYGSASEVIRDALRRFSDQDRKLASLRHEIDRGLQDIEKGNVAELDVEEVIAEAKALHAKQKKHS